MEVKVYLSLGSNSGDRLDLLKQAIKLIHQRAGTVLKISKCYETIPVGFTSETNFINLAIECKTRLSPAEFFNITSTIEHELGRKRVTTGTYSSRTIDIDIIFFGDQIINTSELVVPHPRYMERAFVLIPLNDLDEGLTDPQTKCNIHDLVSQTNDLNGIKAMKSSIKLLELID
ncbi:MAG: 2-amino-4-hydroxy-6-hydroxymethyldihydropteridine diphosphokinase [Bacteroidetes bacterium]|nr:MAG: 2-amino-4-hydroxy-6-hydroxymethyldihydropteridine diphosphokinase [Bacteroidota bacterium]